MQDARASRQLEFETPRNPRPPKGGGIRHGLSRTRAYQSWTAMIGRCYNPKNKGYKGYGGRGIEVCERWHEFLPFYEDMGERPEHGSIDRLDKNWHYIFDNCRWATARQQRSDWRIGHADYVSPLPSESVVIPPPPKPKPAREKTAKTKLSIRKKNHNNCLLCNAPMVHNRVDATCCSAKCRTEFCRIKKILEGREKYLSLSERFRSYTNRSLPWLIRDINLDTFTLTEFEERVDVR